MTTLEDLPEIERSLQYPDSYPNFYYPRLKEDLEILYIWAENPELKQRIRNITNQLGDRPSALKRATAEDARVTELWRATVPSSSALKQVTVANDRATKMCVVAVSSSSALRQVTATNE